LRISLALTLFGAGLMTTGMLLIGGSIYLGIKQAVPTGASAALSDCDLDCSSARYTIQQLPVLDETPAPDENRRLSPSPKFIETSDIKGLAPLLADSTDNGSVEVEPTPTQIYLRLADATSEERDPQPDQPVAIATKEESGLTHLTPTPALSLADTLSPETLPGESAQIVTTASTGIPTTPASAEAASAESGRPERDLGTALEYVEPYTSTDQVQAPPVEAKSGDEIAGAVEMAYACPTSSNDHFELIPIEGRLARDHPAAVHGDLNLVLRGYIPTRDVLGLVDYSGDTDPNAPQLSGLFEPNRVPQIRGVYRVNDWNWDSSQCGGHPRGCPAPPADTYWQVTLVGLAATPGEPIYTPERGLQIYRGGYVAMVLYAEKQRITLGYTRRDHVASGYVVHLEDVCVNPNLIALYQAQLDGAGWNDTGHLPALRNDQALGTALNSEIKVALRDSGSFMDPRSRKDWWR
jgi:hypothetical protein